MFLITARSGPGESTRRCIYKWATLAQPYPFENCRNGRSGSTALRYFPATQGIPRMC